MLLFSILPKQIIQIHSYSFRNSGSGGTTSKKVKSLIPKGLAIFLLAPIAYSHYNSHYLNCYKSL